MTAIEFNHQLINLEDKLERFAYSLTLNRDDAKDLLQETMLKAMSFREQFINPANLKAWTYTIMKNTFINNYRKSIRHSVVTDPTKNLYFQNKSRDNYDFAPDTYYAANEISLLIDKLHPDFKIPFKLMLEGYKYKDIADKLGLKLGTVKSRIFFTRKMLMDSLKEYSGESKEKKVNMG